MISEGGFRFDQACLSHTGKVRKANEDSFVARPEVGLWAVCDGMGGHENGQWASRTIAERLAACEPEGDLETKAQIAAAAIHEANRIIYAEASEQGKAMGSTAVALVVSGRRFAVLWAGDSRIYVLRDGALVQLTRDHTQVHDMVERGLLDPEDAKRHPLSHVLSRAVGVSAELELDGVVDEVLDDDIFVLCSDGLTGPLSDEEIAEPLSVLRLSTASEKLVDMCLARGAPDNVTVIAVHCNEITLVSFA